MVYGVVPWPTHASCTVKVQTPTPAVSTRF